MTEQQIDELRALLASSNARTGSKELDERILAEAAKHASELAADSASRFKWFAPGGFAVAAALSTVVTAAIFVVLNKMVTPVPPASRLVDQQQRIDFEIEVLPVPADSRHEIANVERPSAPTANQRATLDESLGALELPSAQLVIADMEFSVAKERDAASLLVASALSDINLMIGDGYFEQARDRYQELRRVCEGCKLPESLEELAQISVPVVDSG